MLRLLGKDGLRQVPVMEREHLVGLLAREDVLRSLEMRQELAYPTRLTDSVRHASVA